MTEEHVIQYTEFGIVMRLCKGKKSRSCWVQCSFIDIVENMFKASVMNSITDGRKKNYNYSYMPFVSLY